MKELYTERMQLTADYTTLESCLDWYNCCWLTSFVHGIVIGQCAESK